MPCFSSQPSICGASAPVPRIAARASGSLAHTPANALAHSSGSFTSRSVPQTEPGKASSSRPSSRLAAWVPSSRNAPIYRAGKYFEPAGVSGVQPREYLRPFAAHEDVARPPYGPSSSRGTNARSQRSLLSLGRCRCSPSRGCREQRWRVVSQVGQHVIAPLQEQHPFAAADRLVPPQRDQEPQGLPEPANASPAADGGSRSGRRSGPRGLAFSAA